MPKVSVEPFLRWVAEDAEAGYSREGFVLMEAPSLDVPLGLTKEEPTLKTTSAPERCTDERAPMNLPDVVQAAVRTRLQTELKPVADKLARLRATLDAFEVRAKQDAERRVSNSMLAALGEPQVDADPAFEATRKELQDALSQVGSLVGLDAPPKDPPSTEPEPESAPASQAPEEVPPVSAPAPPPRLASQNDIQWAKRLITEAETLKAEIKGQHATRLFPLLQAITAEIRLLLDRLPEDHFFHERLGSLIPLIGALKAEGGVDEYIRGLAFGSTGDWQHLSHKNRRRVEAFDRDVERTERRAPKSSSGLDQRFGTIGDLVKKPLKATPEANHSWPDLPNIRKLSKPILLSGGILIPEKLKSVKERFGLDVEWHEIDHDNPRASQSLVSRIRAGKIGAIVLLEGVMRHSTFKPVVEACNNMNVPFAMGDKAGLASLQSAFAELERKLGC